jgi:hypothetical protein
MVYDIERGVNIGIVEKKSLNTRKLANTIKYL